MDHVEPFSGVRKYPHLRVFWKTGVSLPPCQKELIYWYTKTHSSSWIDNVDDDDDTFFLPRGLVLVACLAFCLFWGLVRANAGVFCLLIGLIRAEMDTSLLLRNHMSKRNN